MVIPKSIMELAKVEAVSEKVISQTVKKHRGTSRAPMIAQPYQNSTMIMSNGVELVVT